MAETEALIFLLRVRAEVTVAPAVPDDAVIFRLEDQVWFAGFAG